jgi:predicted metal-binding protein
MKLDMDKLLAELKLIHDDISPISADKIVVANWVRLKCRFGCHGYGRHLGCPPYTPTPDETKKILEEYELAVIARFDVVPNSEVSPKHLHHHLWSSIGRVHETIFQLERRAFLYGCYKAFGMNALPCTYCETCIPEEKEVINPYDLRHCRHKDRARPSMEACGIDVFKTASNAGYNPEVLRSYHERAELFGMVLLD